MTMSWHLFAAADPELAAFGKERLHDKVAYLATIRTDGAPRLHPAGRSLLMTVSSSLWNRPHPKGTICAAMAVTSCMAPSPILVVSHGSCTSSTLTVVRRW